MSDRHKNYEDGALYAIHGRLYMSPVVTARWANGKPRHYKMGAEVAACRDEETAVELARVYNEAKGLGQFAKKRRIKR